MLYSSSNEAITSNESRRTPKHTKRVQILQKSLKLSILIPCYNEAGTISLILDKIVDVELPGGVEREIIVVNDCSFDDTDTMICEYIDSNPLVPIHYIQHKTNLGKGAAIQSAVQVATGDYVLIQDADLEYTPADYNRLIEPILNGDADVVYGSRFMGGGPHRILFFWHTLGNKLLTLVSNMLTNMNLTDAHTCYKILSRELFESLSLKEKGFAFDAELNVKISRQKDLRIYEVGISYYGRTYKEGKKIRIKDAFKSIKSLLHYRIVKR